MRKALYDYDAFGNEKDENPFRYCGEYFDVETETVYLRARDYRPVTGRFTAEDTHWHPSNMIYGDNPVKWNTSNPPGRNIYKPDVTAIAQHSNGYAYGINNPVYYKDSLGSEAERVDDYDGLTTMIPGLGSAKLKNLNGGRETLLKRGWSYRYDLDRSGAEQNHMHLLRDGEDYSQNDDGSNHHDPKGGSGPPKSVQKLLKEKLDGIGMKKHSTMQKKQR